MCRGDMPVFRCGECIDKIIEKKLADERAKMFLKYNTRDLCAHCQNFSKFVRDFNKDKKAELKKLNVTPKIYKGTENGDKK